MSQHSVYAAICPGSSTVASQWAGRYTQCAYCRKWVKVRRDGHLATHTSRQGATT